VRAVYFLIERFGFSYVVAAQAPVHIRRTRRGALEKDQDRRKCT
jgi:hypothetical protein